MKNRKAEIRTETPYISGLYNYNSKVVDVWVEIPGYGGFKQTILHTMATPEGLEKLRVEGEAEIRRVIETYSVGDKEEVVAEEEKAEEEEKAAA